jgi:hypothetical protein
MQIEVVQVYVSDVSTEVFLDEIRAFKETGNNYEQHLALKIGCDYFKLEAFKNLIR